MAAAADPIRVSLMQVEGILGEALGDVDAVLKHRSGLTAEQRYMEAFVTLYDAVVTARTRLLDVNDRLGGAPVHYDIDWGEG